MISGVFEVSLIVHTNSLPNSPGNRNDDMADLGDKTSANSDKEDEALFDDLERESKEFDKDAEIDRKPNALLRLTSAINK